MKSFFAISFILICYFIYGISIAQFEVAQIPKTIERPHPQPFYDYKGVTNVHSNLSLGSGDFTEIIQSAKISGLDFILITDLNLFDQNNIIEGYHDNLLALSAGKYSYLDSRLIFYNSSNHIPANNLGDLQIKFNDILSQPSVSNKDSALVLTHPLRKGFTWAGEYPIGLDGIEMINFRSIQQNMWEESKTSSLWSLLIYPFNPSLAFLRLFSEPSEERDLWDKLNLKQIVTGHLGLEATARAIPYTGKTIKFPSYETIFSLGSQHVILKSELTGNPIGDRLKIIKALKRGEFYFSLDILGNPKGFNVLLHEGSEVRLMGSTVPFKKGQKLSYKLPTAPLSSYEVIFYRNGERIQTLSTLQGTLPIEKPGSYRILVKLFPELPIPDQKRGIPWIYSNPFLITDRESQ